MVWVWLSQLISRNTYILARTSTHSVQFIDHKSVVSRDATIAFREAPLNIPLIVAFVAIRSFAGTRS